MNYNPLNKNSFTLFEVIISLIILSIVISSVVKLYTKNNSVKIYYNLEKMENEYITTKKVTNSDNIKFVIPN